MSAAESLPRIKEQAGNNQALETQRFLRRHTSRHSGRNPFFPVNYLMPHGGA